MMLTRPPYLFHAGGFLPQVNTFRRSPYLGPASGRAVYSPSLGAPGLFDAGSAHPFGPLVTGFQPRWTPPALPWGMGGRGLWSLFGGE